MAALLDSDLAYAKEGPKAKVVKMYGNFDIIFGPFLTPLSALYHPAHARLPVSPSPRLSV